MQLAVIREFSSVVEDLPLKIQHVGLGPLYLVLLHNLIDDLSQPLPLPGNNRVEALLCLFHYILVFIAVSEYVYVCPPQKIFKFVF